MSFDKYSLDGWRKGSQETKSMEGQLESGDPEFSKQQHELWLPVHGLYEHSSTKFAYSI